MEITLEKLGYKLEVKNGNPYYGGSLYLIGTDIACLPMQDKRFAEMLRGKQFRSTNDGSLSSEPLLIEWLRNWHLTNLNN